MRAASEPVCVSRDEECVDRTGEKAPTNDSTSTRLRHLDWDLSSVLRLLARGPHRLSPPLPAAAVAAELERLAASLIELGAFGDRSRRNRPVPAIAALRDLVAEVRSSPVLSHLDLRDRAARNTQPVRNLLQFASALAERVAHLRIPVKK